MFSQATGRSLAFFPAALHQQAAFGEFEVESSGVGHGTITRFEVTAAGRTREYRMRVTEPEPGRVLTESDMNSNLVTTFTVTPQNAASRVEIYTTWKGAAGIGGARAGLRYPGHVRHLRR